MEKNDNWGFHAFIRGIILFGFTMLLLSFVLSGSIKYYIAPKMMPFIYFALVVFVMLSILQIIRSTPKGQEEELECDCGIVHQATGSKWKHGFIYLIFVFPLLLGFVLPEKTLDSSVAENRGVTLGAGVTSKDLQNKTQTEKKSEVESPSTARAEEYLENLDENGEPIEHYTVEDIMSGDTFDDYYAELLADLLKQDVIQITEDNFLDVMTVFDLYMDQLKGKKVELVGFVYREPGMEMDEMVVARFSMTCCTADSGVYGLLAKSDLTRQYQNDTWIKVTGTLDETSLNDFDIPIIIPDQLLEVEEPDDPYVYPSFGF